MSKGILLFLIFVLAPLLTFGQGIGTNGSLSLLHVQSASTLKPKRLDVKTDLNFFSKVGDFIGQQKPDNFSTVNFWDVQTNLLLSYGLSNHFDASFLVRTYQDVHKVNEFNAPGDMFLDIKAGSFGFANNRINLGGILNFRFPTGEDVNYFFENYTGGSLEFGFMGLFSFYNDPFLPHRDLSIHANLGWYNHNDAGKLIFTTASDSATARNNASALRFGLGFTYPTELFDLNLEVWGNNFIEKPDSFAFSRENFAYVTPSIRFKPKWWASFDLGIDLRMSGDKEESAPLLANQVISLSLPNYASWRLRLGLNLVLNGGNDRIRGGISEKADINTKVNFYERLLKEREKTKSIEEELQRLKREREQAEKELEELRQLLEEEG